MVNPKFELWARTCKVPLDLTRAPEGSPELYANPHTEHSYLMWMLIAGSCAKIADDGARLMSRVKGEGAARVAGAIRDAFGLAKPRKPQ